MIHARLVLLFLAGGIAYGQTTQGMISGAIRNSRTGAAISGATVSYVQSSTGASGSGRSDASGNYFLPLLTPGFYRIRIAAGAYQAQEVQELELPVAARVELNFQLRPLSDVWESGQYRSVFLPGSKSIVTFYGPDVDTSRSGSFEAVRGRRGALESTLSEVINPLQVRDLPLAGRDVYTMLVTQPGVTADAGTSRGLGLSVMGQRPSASNFMLDGLENNNYLITGPLSPIAPEAIQEYRVSTNNFSAEYGRTPGFLANAITKSGGNQFHGLGYFYLKNEALNANGFQENRLGLERPAAKERQLGFQVGGPVLRDRLFFSAAYENFRSRGSGDTVSVRLPTPDLLRNLAENSPGRRLLTQYPTPAPRAANGAIFIDLPYTLPVSLDRTLANVRVDYTPRGGADRVMARYSLARIGRPDFIWSPYADFVSGLDQNVDSLAANYTRRIRPGLLNEFKFGYGRDRIGWARANPDIATFVVPHQGVPVIMPGSLAAYAYRNNSTTVELLDNVVWTRGRHVATFGGGLLLRRLDGFLTIGRDGQYRFEQQGISGLISFILSNPSMFFVATDSDSSRVRSPQYDRQYHYRQMSFFAQDTFKASRRLSLNFGLRYENFGSPSNTGAAKDSLLVLGQGSTRLQQTIRATFVKPGAGDQQLYQSDNNDWAGRFGFSYDLTGRGNTLFRAAYGIFYDRPFDNLWQNMRANGLRLVPFSIPLFQQVDFLEPVDKALPRYQSQSDAVDVANFPAITYFRPEIRSPYSQTYFYGLQHRLSDSWNVEVNGAGSLGRKLLVTDTWNRDLLAQYGYLYYRDSQGLSNYQALTAIARYRGRHAQFQAAYTFSHSIDHQSEPLQGDFFNLNFVNLSGGGQGELRAAFTREGDIRRDRGSSDFDQRHNLVFYSIWELPRLGSTSPFGILFRDWRFAQLAAFRSGFPFSVAAPALTDLATRETYFNNRADLVDPNGARLDPAPPVAGGKLLLNRAAFRSPSGAGNLGRNALGAPGFYNIDISLARTFPVRWLGESGRITLRADAFNFLNHANLSGSDNFINDSTFGIAQYGRRGRESGFPALTPFQEAGRQIQMILRLEF